MELGHFDTTEQADDFDQFEFPYDYHDHPADPPVNVWDEDARDAWFESRMDADYEGDADYWKNYYYGHDNDPTVEPDDDFPMSLEYEGPFGLSGYDEY